MSTCSSTSLTALVTTSTFCAAPLSTTHPESLLCPYSVMQADTLPQIFGGLLGPEEGGCYLYGRSFNPTVRYLGKQMAAIEGTEAGYGTSSGILLSPICS